MNEKIKLKSCTNHLQFTAPTVAWYDDPNVRQL